MKEEIFFIIKERILSEDHPHLGNIESPSLQLRQITKVRTLYRIHKKD